MHRGKILPGLIAWIGCIWMMVASAMAQLPLPAAPVYAHYHTTNSTLPTDLIYRIHADHNGYIWLATDRGLVRYNGRTFTSVNTGPQEDFISICVTENKQLWLLAYSGHTVAIDLNTQKVIQTDDLYGLQHLPTSGRPFLRAIGQGNVLTLYSQAGYGGKWVVRIRLDKHESRLYHEGREEAASQFFKQYHFPANWEQRLMPELQEKFVRNFSGLWAKDSFIIAGNKIFTSIPGKEATLYFNGDDYGIRTDITGFARRDEDLYLGDLHAIGLCYIRGYFSRPRSQQVIIPLLSQERITSMEQDYLGNIWVGTYDNGLFLFPYTEGHTLYYNQGSSGLYSDKVSSIGRFSGGTTVLGYEDAMMDFYTGNGLGHRYALPANNYTREVRHVEKLDHCWLAFTPNESFYAGSPGRTFPDTFRAVLTDYPALDRGYKNGKQLGHILYYISGVGLVSIDTTGCVMRRHTGGYALPKRLCLLPLSDTDFYLGTVRGCYRNEQALPYLQDVQINAVDTVNGQLIWCTNIGVFTLPQQDDRNSRLLFRRVISDPCNALKHDSLFTYLRSGDHLIVIQNSTLEPVARFSCRDYTIPFRLSDFYIDSTYLALSGNRGVLYIPRQNLIRPCTARKPRMHVLCSLNDKAPADSLYRCLYQSGLAVLFELDILDYKSGRRDISCHVFRDGKELYRQADLDEQGAITLHPETPGRYRVEYHVQSADCKTERVLSYTLLVLPLWYQQWWSMPVLILLAMLAGGGLLYPWYARKVKDARQKLKQQLYLQELEAQSLLSQLKPHFIFNVLTPLQGFFMRGEKIRGLDYLENFSRLMRGMLNSIRDKYAPLATEMNFIEHYLQVQQERFDFCFAYHIRIDPSLNAARCMIPTLLLQPLVENAVEHGIIKTRKDGQITLLVRDMGTAIAIEIKDNGKGLPDDFRLQQNHALTIISERMQLLKRIKGTGQFSIYNNSGGEPGVTSLLILSKDNRAS